MTDPRDTVWAMGIKALHPLDPDHVVLSFTSDPTLSWVAAYAGPCPEMDCDDGHRRLYAIPIIGWLHVKRTDGVVLRPAIMASTGTVTDFLDVPSAFLFLGVLLDGDDMPLNAHAIYRQKVGHLDTEELDLDATTLMAN